MNEIIEIVGREIIERRGKKKVEVDVVIEDGYLGREDVK